MKNLILCILLILIASNLIAQNPNHFYYSVEKKTDKVKTDSIDEVVTVGYSQPKLKALFYGSGGFQNILGESPSGDNLNGAIGITIFKPKKFQFYFSATLSKNEPVNISTQKGFGTALMLQNVTGNSLSFGGIRYFGRLGVSADVQFTSSEWNINDTIYGADPISMKLQLAYMPFPELSNLGNNSFDFIIRLGYSNRLLLSDIAFDKNKEVRKRVFNTEKTNFHGLELDVELIINKKTTLFAQLPILFSSDEIDGLTNPRVNIGVRITGDLINLTE